MSETMTPGEEASTLAAEYVIGLLDAAEMRSIAGRAALDPVLAADIAAWESRLAPLALLVPPVAPPAAVWARLQAGVGTANDNRLRRWKIGTALSLVGASAAVVLALWAVEFQPHLSPVMTVAALAPLSGTGTAFLVRSLPDGSLQVAALTPAKVPGGRDLELWALPAGAKTPVSLGVLPAGGRVIAASALTQPGGKILVSLEPKGGSPTGLPTGPVLYGGEIVRL